MNFFSCLLVAIASFSCFSDSVNAFDDASGMMMISGPMIHRRVIHRRPYFLRNHHHQKRLRRHRKRHAAKSKAFIEVVNVRERIIVDEQNHPKGAEAVFSNDLLSINPSTGQMRMLMHREIHLKPKLPERKFIVNEYGVDGALRRKAPAPWVQACIKRFRLDSFWPLLAFSVVMGFTFVGLTFVAAKCILTLLDGEAAVYEPLLSDEDLLRTVPTAQPIQLTDEMTERTINV